jgi:tRNA-modifying protein YgfZ
MAETFAAKLDSRALIALTGADAVSFLQGLISNDVEQVQPGTAIYAALLTPQGKFLFDLFVYSNAGGFWIDVDRARRAELIGRLQMYKLRAKIEVVDRSSDYDVVALWGDLDGGIPMPGTFPDPRLGTLGWRGRADRAVAEKLTTPEIEYHKHRVLLGVPDGGMDLEPEQTFLLEGNFEELNGVDFKKGCYVGQELTARMKHRGTARRRMLPLKGASALPSPGTSVVDETGREVGELRGAIGDLGMGGFRLDRLKEARQLTADGVTLMVLRPAYSVIGWETSS